MQGIKFEYLKLHISVLLAGFTGILAKLIPMNEGLIVFYRMLFAFLIFCIMLFFMKKKPVENLSNSIKIIGLGALLALHLVFFFGSIKYSSVSIGVVCYSLVGFFTVLFQPMIEKTKFSFIELFFSLLAVFGIWLIFSFDTSYRFGIILGIISAALFALYTLYFTVGLAGNLEPIYGILLAVIFFGEAHDFTLSFYIGMTLILLSVFLQSILKKQAIAK